MEEASTMLRTINRVTALSFGMALPVEAHLWYCVCMWLRVSGMIRKILCECTWCAHAGIVAYICARMCAYGHEYLCERV